MQKISVYVPSRNVDGITNYLAQFEYAEKVALDFSVLFGGATISDDNTGIWRDPSGEIVRESITVVYSYTDKDEAFLRGYLTLVLSRIATELNQTIAMGTIEPATTVLFIEPIKATEKVA